MHISWSNVMRSCYPLETTRNGLGIHTAAQELQKKSFQAGMALVMRRDELEVLCAFMMRAIG